MTQPTTERQAVGSTARDDDPLVRIDGDVFRALSLRVSSDPTSEPRIVRWLGAWSRAGR